MLFTFTLLRSRSLVGLPGRSLMLDENFISDQGLITLFSSPDIADLEELNLGGNAFGEEGLQAIAASPYLTKLRIMYLDIDEYDPGNCEIIGLSTTLPPAIRRPFVEQLPTELLRQHVQRNFFLRTFMDREILIEALLEDK